MRKYWIPLLGVLALLLVAIVVVGNLLPPGSPVVVALSVGTLALGGVGSMWIARKREQARHSASAKD